MPQEIDPRIPAPQQVDPRILPPIDPRFGPEGPGVIGGTVATIADVFRGTPVGHTGMLQTRVGDKRLREFIQPRPEEEQMLPGMVFDPLAAGAWWKRIAGAESPNYQELKQVVDQVPWMKAYWEDLHFGREAARAAAKAYYGTDTPDPKSFEVEREKLVELYRKSRAGAELGIRPPFAIYKELGVPLSGTLGHETIESNALESAGVPGIHTAPATDDEIAEAMAQYISMRQMGEYPRDHPYLMRAAVVAGYMPQFLGGAAATRALAGSVAKTAARVLGTGPKAQKVLKAISTLRLPPSVMAGLEAGGAEALGPQMIRYAVTGEVPDTEQIITQALTGVAGARFSQALLQKHWVKLVEASPGVPPELIRQHLLENILGKHIYPGAGGLAQGFLQQVKEKLTQEQPPTEAGNEWLLAAWEEVFEAVLEGLAGKYVPQRSERFLDQLQATLEVDEDLPRARDLNVEELQSYLTTGEIPPAPRVVAPPPVEQPKPTPKPKVEPKKRPITPKVALEESARLKKTVERAQKAIARDREFISREIETEKDPDRRVALQAAVKAHERAEGVLTGSLTASPTEASQALSKEASRLIQGLGDRIPAEAMTPKAAKKAVKDYRTEIRALTRVLNAATEIPSVLKPGTHEAAAALAVRLSEGSVAIRGTRRVPITPEGAENIARKIEKGDLKVVRVTRPGNDIVLHLEKGPAIRITRPEDVSTWDETMSKLRDKETGTFSWKRASPEARAEAERKVEESVERFTEVLYPRFVMRVAKGAGSILGPRGSENVARSLANWLGPNYQAAASLLEPEERVEFAEILTKAARRKRELARRLAETSAKIYRLSEQAAGKEVIRITYDFTVGLDRVGAIGEDVKRYGNQTVQRMIQLAHELRRYGAEAGELMAEEGIFTKETIEKHSKPGFLHRFYPTRKDYGGIVQEMAYARAFLEESGYGSVMRAGQYIHPRAVARVLRRVPRTLTAEEATQKGVLKTPEAIEKSIRLSAGVVADLKLLRDVADSSLFVKSEEDLDAVAQQARADIKAHRKALRKVVKEIRDKGHPEIKKPFDQDLLRARGDFLRQYLLLLKKKQKLEAKNEELSPKDAADLRRYKNRKELADLELIGPQKQDDIKAAQRAYAMFGRRVDRLEAKVEDLETQIESVKEGTRERGRLENRLNKTNSSLREARKDLEIAEVSIQNPEIWGTSKYVQDSLLTEEGIRLNMKAQALRLEIAFMGKEAIGWHKVPDHPSWGPLRKGWIRNDLWYHLKYRSEPQNRVWRAWLSMWQAMTMTMKKNLTARNPGVHITNYFSNFIGNDMFGLAWYTPEGIRTYATAHLQYMGWGQRDAIWNDWARSDLPQAARPDIEVSQTRKIRDALKAAKDESSWLSPVYFFEAGFHLVDTVMGIPAMPVEWLYPLEDNVMAYSLYRHQRERGRSHEDAERIVNSYYNYGEVAPWVSTGLLSRRGIPSFISFMYKSTSSLPAAAVRRGIGPFKPQPGGAVQWTANIAMGLANLAKYPLLITAYQLSFPRMMGMTDDEAEDFERQLYAASYGRTTYSWFIIPLPAPKSEDGLWTFFDAGNILWMKQWLDPIREGKADPGPSWASGMIRQNVGLTALWEAYMGVSFFEEEIFGGERAWRATRNLLPGLLSTPGEMIYRKTKGRSTLTPFEIAMRSAGIKIVQGSEPKWESARREALIRAGELRYGKAPLLPVGREGRAFLRRYYYPRQRMRSFERLLREGYQAPSWLAED